MAKEEKPLEYERRIVDTKGLAQRIDLNYLRRPHAFRALRRRLMWGAPLLAALAILPLFFGGGRKAFSAGPVSQPHAIFESRCSLCHASAFNAVADKSCQTCHDAGSHREGVAESRCADCHREHQGSFSLSQVSDLRCTRCHANLASALRQRAPAVAARITGFTTARHPEFRAISAPDQRPLRLNHQKHMVLRKEDTQRFKLAGTLLPMKCGDCHTPQRDSATGDMMPISFDRHCRACHARELEFDVNHLLRPEGGVAPHLRDAAAIRDTIQNDYRALVARDPSVTRRTLGRDFVAKNEAEWIATAVRQSADFLFSRKCSYCHGTGLAPHQDAAAAAVPFTSGGLPAIRKVNKVEGRYVAEKPEGEPWLARSRKFSHRVHRPVACAGCHEKSATSSSTADVLIPSARTCMPCHGKTGTAQDNCSQCHLYHDRSKEVDRDRRPIEELIARSGKRLLD